MIPIKIVVSSKSKLPAYQSKGSAGADLFAALEDELIIEPGQVKLVPTGIYVEIPEGYEAQIRPRSGLAFKSGIGVLNSPGTIDSDYRGEIKIIMINFGEEPFAVSHGMRIAQMIFSKVYHAHFIPVKDLEDTKRGTGGFGHTGI